MISSIWSLLGKLGVGMAVEVFGVGPTEVEMLSRNLCNLIS